MSHPPGPEVHVTIDSLVVHALSRSQTRDLVAGMHAGLEASLGGEPSVTGSIGREPASNRSGALGRTVARRIAEAGRL